MIGDFNRRGQGNDGGDHRPQLSATPQAQARIKSYVRREGRLTRGQARNLDALWPKYGLTAVTAAQGPRAIFGRAAPVTLEIGFGAGEALVALAADNPQRDYLGVEVYRSGVGQVLGHIEALGLSNLRLLCEDAVEVLAQLPGACLDELLLYFPDPWPKKRHHKRRLVQPPFADAVARVLEPGGVWRLATDWADYAEWMREVLDPHPAFTNAGDNSGFVADPPRPTTRFEARGRRKGHAVFDLAYRRR